MNKHFAAVTGSAVALVVCACDYDWSTPPEPEASDAQATAVMAVRARDAAAPASQALDASPLTAAFDAGAVATACTSNCDSDAPVMCPEQRAPEHGSVDQTRERASFQCAPGYEREGPAETTCRGDGNWSAAAPSCRMVNCGPLSDPKRGSVSLSGTGFGDVAEYVCSTGLVLVGSAKRACEADGQWTAAAPSCECSSDLTSDPHNCGGCGVSCSSGTCASGECVRRVFVSSAAFAPNFGSLARADDACQRAADTAHLAGPWKAWLSDATNSPATRFARGTGEYRRIDGMKVADNFTDLSDGTLQNPINVTELGRAADSSAGSYVYTGTLADGSPVMLAASDPSARLGTTCQDWTTNLPTAWGAYGTFTTVTASWSYGGGTIPCSTLLPVYCVEQ